MSPITYHRSPSGTRATRRVGWPLENIRRMESNMMTFVQMTGGWQRLEEHGEGGKR